MKPVPISDDVLAQLHPHGARKVLAAPDGDLTNDTIAPLEVVWEVVTTDDGPHLTATSYWRPTDDELTDLQSGGVLAVTIFGPPHPPIALKVI